MSMWGLGLITIGCGWLVSRLFLVVDLRLMARESQESIVVCVISNHYPVDMNHGMPAICNQCTGFNRCMYEWHGLQVTGKESGE
ncbi:hypothetical protein [Oscillibacter sp. GMB15532]|uniref:hypothetical protein n=1 Tax=Oscillibacter sp. GMB15532 TaxID=3230022 RepID=UPI0034E032DD